MTLFSYSHAGGAISDPMPRFAVTLRRAHLSLDVYALVDSGATLNIIPYSVGLALGGQWEHEWPISQLSGAFGKLNARGMVVEFLHPELTGNSALNLAFAWVQRDDVPIILGQKNFFEEFNICFFRADSTFEIERRHSG